MNLLSNNNNNTINNDDDEDSLASTTNNDYENIIRKLNLLKQIKITFESLIFNSANSPSIWSNLANGVMIIFIKNILSILQDELIIESNEIEDITTVNNNNNIKLASSLAHHQYLQQPQQYRSLSFSSPLNNTNNKYRKKYSLKPVSSGQQLVLQQNQTSQNPNQQLWSFIKSSLNTTDDTEIRRIFVKIDNDYFLNTKDSTQQSSPSTFYLNVCLDWIRSSLKSYNFLKQLKLIYDNDSNKSNIYNYYKPSSFLNDNSFRNDFFLFIASYETRDFNRLNDLNAFKLYNYLNQKRLSYTTSMLMPSKEIMTTSSTMSDSVINENDSETVKSHRRLHSCPIMVHDSQVPIIKIESDETPNVDDQQMGRAGKSSSIMFDLELSNNNELEKVVDKSEISQDVVEIDAKSNVEKLYEQVNVLDYIHSQQVFYERNLLDKENSHFLIADLTMNAIELLKDQSDNKQQQQQQQQSIVMHNAQLNVIIEPINLKKFYFRNLFNKNDFNEKYLNTLSTSLSFSTSTSTNENNNSSASSDSNSVIELRSSTTAPISIDLATTPLFDAVLTASSPFEINNNDEIDENQEETEFETIDFKEQQIFENALFGKRERRFSWEDDSNDTIYTAESLAKNLFDKYKQLKLPNLIQLKHIIENRYFSEFTQKFLENNLNQPFLESTRSNNSVKTLVPTATQLHNSVSIKAASDALIGDDKWAPVREQLIITDQKQKLNRNQIMKLQDFRCANCGIKVKTDQVKQFRYCEYFSKYFCRCCHSKSESYIPSYIIFNLDFKQTYNVSNKAKIFLEKIYYEPLITLEDLNPSLFNDKSKSSLFIKIKHLRLKLVNCKRYVTSCRLAFELKQHLEKNFMDFLYNDTRVYSIDSLYKFKKGNLYEELKLILQKITQHILTCEICSQQGFVCEICKNTKLIYPFDIENVVKCPNCLSCYHRKCFQTPEQCLKCQRKKTRVIPTTPTTPTNNNYPLINLLDD